MKNHCFEYKHDTTHLQNKIFAVEIFKNKKLKIFDFFQNVKNLLGSFAAETLQIKQSR